VTNASLLPGTPLMNLRRLLVSVVAMGLAAGCGQYGVSGPNDVGLSARMADAQLPVDMGPDFASLTAAQLKLQRNAILNRWIVKSDFLCADYQLSLSREIRDSRLAMDILATALSGAATIFANPAVTRPLTGATSIALGIGGDIQSDLFLQQAGDVVSTAIQTVRAQARNALQAKQSAEYVDYIIEQGLVDVQRYDRETCNLNVGLNQIRAALNLAGAVVPQANNPIIPLTPVGGAPGLAGAVPPPAATVVMPPSVQNIGGHVVITPGSVSTVPAVQPPPSSPRPSAVVIPPRPNPTPAQPATPADSADQTAFRDAFRGLKHDDKGALLPESRQIVDQCATPFFPAGTPIADIRKQGGTNLKTITACIKAKT
jgi:hypothetical protein